jgi:pimeloyl-ACP methyl ester carboxylesterase
MIREESFCAADGVELRYTLRQAGHRRVVLVAPGIFVHRGNPEHVALAQALLAVADVATLDVRGHGDSGGAFTWGLREPQDVAGLAASLQRRYPRVGGLGFSFGGYHTAVAAALHGAFDAVALVATPRSLFILDHNFLTGGLRRSLPLMLQRQRRLTRVSLSPGGRRAVPDRLVERIAPRPLLIVHGTADWLIPPKHAQTLFDRAREPKQLLLIEDGLHAEYLLQQHAEQVIGPLRDFFDRGL